ncbi:hypothetical protein R3P38DRAFT_2762316 [Favolaschia claudopus]|uniref:Uncharacterized protein n=1 Tax=Favolaschia claudopus TaxID=2862362 RepID=A0AAW0DL90_9AGAR
MSSSRERGFRVLRTPSTLPTVVTAAGPRSGAISFTGRIAVRYGTVFLTSVKLEVSSTFKFITGCFVVCRPPSPFPSNQKILRCAALVITTKIRDQNSIFERPASDALRWPSENFLPAARGNSSKPRPPFRNLRIRFPASKALSSAVFCAHQRRSKFSPLRGSVYSFKLSGAQVWTWDFKFHGFHADLKFTRHTSGPLPRVIPVPDQRRSETLKQAGKRASCGSKNHFFFSVVCK